MKAAEKLKKSLVESETLRTPAAGRAARPTPTAASTSVRARHSTSRTTMRIPGQEETHESPMVSPLLADTFGVTAAMLSEAIELDRARLLDIVEGSSEVIRKAKEALQKVAMMSSEEMVWVEAIQKAERMLARIQKIQKKWEEGRRVC